MQLQTLQCLTRCWQRGRKALRFIRSRRRQWLRATTIGLSIYRPAGQIVCLSVSLSVSFCVCVWLKRSTAKCWLISGHAACHKSWVLNYSRQLDSTRLGLVWPQPDTGLLGTDTATCNWLLATCHKQAGRQARSRQCQQDWKLLPPAPRATSASCCKLIIVFYSGRLQWDERAHSGPLLLLLLL